MAVWNVESPIFLSNKYKTKALGGDCGFFHIEH